MLTNPRDAFGGQSRSPNIVYVRYGFLLVCYSKSVWCTVFEIFDFKNAVTLKTGLGVCRGHWKCHHSMERDSVYDLLLTFYSNYVSISYRFWDNQCWKISRPWNPGQGSIKVIDSGTIR